MANRHTSITLLLSLAAAGCGADSSDTSKLNGDETAIDIPEDQLIRTANPYARGYTDSDFPRIQELAPGVYSYEQLRSAGDEKFTTVSMFVVTETSVLVPSVQEQMQRSGGPRSVRR